MRNRFLVLIAAAVVALSLTASCVVRPARGGVYVRVAPPVPVVEVESVAPGPEFIWIRGYHRWDGDHYAWIAGHWERRPHAAAVWVQGQWRHHRNGWFWVEGHWR